MTARKKINITGTSARLAVEEATKQLMKIDGFLSYDYTQYSEHETPKVSVHMDRELFRKMFDVFQTKKHTEDFIKVFFLNTGKLDNNTVEIEYFYLVEL